jgi:hypothetical protein
MKTQIILDPVAFHIDGELDSLMLCTDARHNEVTARMKAGKCLARARGAVKMHLVYQLMRQAQFDVNNPADEIMNLNGNVVRSWVTSRTRTSNGCLLECEHYLCHSDDLYRANAHLTVYAPLDPEQSIYEPASVATTDCVSYRVRISWG